MTHSKPARARHLETGLILVSLVFGCQTGAVEPTSELWAKAREHTLPKRGYDVEHYRIEIELDPPARRIEGRCRIALVATRDALAEVVLDLVGLDVDQVLDGVGRTLPFEQRGAELWVNLPQPLALGESLEVQVDYGGSPQTGLWFSGLRTDGTGPTQVFTQGQAERNRGWFPGLDHPSDRATSELLITCPAEWSTMAAGSLVSSEVNAAANTRTDHWSMETAHPTYLATLVAGEFEVQTSEWDGVPLMFLAEPIYADWMERCFEETDEILTFLSEYTGVRYPYSKYSQAAVANFPWGGMENISATTLTPLIFVDERGSHDYSATGLVAHEAAHQWFGDLFTCADWSHIWLNEGFATYLTLLYYEETRGQDEFRARVRDAQDAGLDGDEGSSRRPTVWEIYKEPEDLFDSHSYEGAAARLHLLRYLMGDEGFRAGVRTFAAENAGRGVVTADLQRAMEKVSGRDLGFFFEQWIYGAGHPEFALDWTWSASSGEVTLEVRQQQSTANGTASVFELPVDVEVRDDGGTTVHRIEINRRSQVVQLPAESKPFYVRFDKHHWIPKRVTWRRSVAEWLAIANMDEDVNGRRDAVRALGVLAQNNRANTPEVHETCVAEIVERLRKDKSSYVRKDAAEALGVAGGTEARERLLASARTDPVAPVRVAALNALTAWGIDPRLGEVAREIFEDEFSWLTMGAAARLVAISDPRGGFAWIESRLELDSPHDQLTAELLDALSRLTDPRVPEVLATYAVDTTLHPTARAAAVRSLASMRRGRTRYVDLFISLLDEDNFRLRQAVVEALSRVGSSDSRSALRLAYPSARTSTERRTIEAALAP